jgi:hypothetical protein
MLYALLVYADPSPWEHMTEEEAAVSRAAVMPRWIAAFEEIGKADPDMQGIELDSGTEAKVVRVRHGEQIVTDGPFAETKELIGGLFLTRLPDLDEAIRIASIVPASEYGSIEIRPVIERAADNGRSS